MEKIIKTNDGHQLNLYIAKPQQSSKQGLIVIQEIFGVTDHIKAMCDKFAGAGFIAAAPALFDRVEPGTMLPYNGEGVEKGRAIRDKISWQMILADVQASYEALKLEGAETVSIVGYCFGGTVAWRAATQTKLFNKASCYYGGQIAEFSHETPNCPVIFHFAKLDRFITADHIEIISKNQPNCPIYLYEADHGFNCSERKVYDPACAELAHQRTLDFFK